MWICFQSAETTRQAAGPTEPESAQTLLGPMGSRGLGEYEATVTFLSKDALGLRLVPKDHLGSQNAASRSAVCAVSEMGPSWVPPKLGKIGVNTRPFHGNSVFSTMEYVFGVGFR